MMLPMNNVEFADYMLKLAKNAPPFKPSATYDPDGDCIECIVKPDSFYAERVDDFLTIYRSHENNEIVGTLLESISKCRKSGL